MKNAVAATIPRLQSDPFSPLATVGPCQYCRTVLPSRPGPELPESRQPAARDESHRPHRPVHRRERVGEVDALDVPFARDRRDPRRVHQPVRPGVERAPLVAVLLAVARWRRRSLPQSFDDFVSEDRDRRVGLDSVGDVGRERDVEDRAGEPVAQTDVSPTAELGRPLGDAFEGDAVGSEQRREVVDPGQSVPAVFRAVDRDDDDTVGGLEGRYCSPATVAPRTIEKTTYLNLTRRTLRSSNGSSRYQLRLSPSVNIWCRQRCTRLI